MIAEADSVQNAKRRPVDAPKPGKRILQGQPKSLNRLEEEFLARLTYSNPGVQIRYQDKIYVVANGLKYIPDFTAIILGREYAWEVKGDYIWEDSIVKIKSMARQWPEIILTLNWKEDGAWMNQIVHP